MPWLLLVHQLPAEPSRLRVKVWRRLQAIGAVALKGSVYALPATAEAREDFEWLRAEIVEQGGEAMVFTASAADGVSSSQIRALLVEARDRDWQALLDRASRVIAGIPASTPGGDDRGALKRQVRSLRARAARIARIDYLEAPTRAAALDALRRLEDILDPRGGAASDASPPRVPADYLGRVWVTRPRPGVDRMASAWLIRRFIDDGAMFEFAEGAPPADAVAFDMFDVEFGHQGDLVTFEVLTREFGIDDPATARLARIVHELDLRAEDLSDPEAATVERLVHGLRAAHDDDARLLEHGIVLFEALHTSFAATP